MIAKDALSVLIISRNAEMRKQIRSLLDRNVFGASANADNAEEARRLLLHSSYDIVIIDAPMPNVIGHELALDITEKGSASVLLLVDSAVYDETRYRVESEGIITVPKPCSADMISMAINISVAYHNRVLVIEEENKKLRFKNEEMRLCNRAKWALHENLGMDEPAAHRYIEKTAMNSRITRYAAAKQILKEYE